MRWRMNDEHTFLYIIIYEHMCESIERLHFAIFIRGIPADISAIFEHISSADDPTILFRKQCLQYMAHWFVDRINTVSLYLCCNPGMTVFDCSPLVSKLPWILKHRTGHQHVFIEWDVVVILHQHGRLKSLKQRLFTDIWIGIMYS